MQSTTKQTIKIYWQHAKRYPYAVAASILAMFFITTLRTYTPFLYKNLINLVATTPIHSSISPMVKIILIILMINFTRVMLWRGFNYINNFFQPRVMDDLVNTCYQYLQKHSYNFFSNNFVGSLVTKIKRYERSYEQITDQILYNLGRSLLEATLILGVLIWNFHTLGFIMLIWSVLYFVFAYIFSIYKLPYDFKRAQADTKTTAQLADTITNNINLKLFTSYNAEFKKFADVTDEQFRLRKKSWDLGTTGDIVQNVFNVGLEFGVIYYAVHYWQAGILTVGDIVLLQSYLLRIFDVLWDTGKNIRSVYEAFADANEMTEILNTPHEIQEAANAKELKVRKGLIEFNKVNFSYHSGSDVFSKFNLIIEPGERVALIGQSGGGKSTITKLLLRFSDIQKGEITIDGQDISKVTQDSLRENISLVPQEPILFHRSLLENIRYGKPNATKAEIIKASKLAHAHEFISSFSEGYDTLVGERGIKLSGGERQRVAIARAILKNAPILILDEATSSLDSESEHYIQEALKTLMKDKTVIVIAHRLSTIMQMDRIIVLEKGKITEQGKHEELVKAQAGTYQKLWQIQAGGFAE